MSWIPVLILCSIVDRNSNSTEILRLKINRFVNHIQKSMVDNPELIANIASDIGSTSELLNELGDQSKASFFSNLFCEFAGQGRTRWHFGVGYSIISGLERYAAQYGREWYQDNIGTRRALLCVSSPQGILSFDKHCMLQVLFAMLFVMGTIAGAFWIAFWTPTVGLGCHSGGYLIFVIIAFALFFLEAGAWIAWPRDCYQRRWANTFMVIGETLSTCWLVYITFAQAFGLYETCDCITSNWSSLGGYVDLGAVLVNAIHEEPMYWISGTIFSSAVLLYGTLWVVLNWCDQSHLTTDDYGNAAKGLMTTRRFLKATRYIRYAPESIARLLHQLWAQCTGRHVTPLVMVWTLRPIYRSQDEEMDKELGNQTEDYPFSRASTVCLEIVRKFSIILMNEPKGQNMSPWR